MRYLGLVEDADIGNLWVIVADGSRARLFTGDRKALTESENMVSTEHRLQERELTSDKAGRSFDSQGAGRHAMEPPMSARERDVIDFAKRLASRLEELRTAGEVDKLVLVAPPKFLGHLRASMNSHTLALVAHAIDKELTQASADVVAEHLPAVI